MNFMFQIKPPLTDRTCCCCARRGLKSDFNHSLSIVHEVSSADQRRFQGRLCFIEAFIVTKMLQETSTGSPDVGADHAKRPLSRS